MKVILQRDVPKVGKTGEIVQVKDGYARNYLFPRQYAVAATGGALKDHDSRLAREKERSAKMLQSAQTGAERLADARLVMIGKVGRGTKLYGSITAQEVGDAIARQVGVTVDRRRIGLADPIKTLGTYKVPVRLHTDVSVPITVEVISEEENVRRQAQAAADAAAAIAAQTAGAAAPAEAAPEPATTAEADTGEAAEGAEAQATA